MRSKPVKFSCCSTNFWVLNDPVAGQRAALTAHTGSRHHQVYHIALLYDHTGDARACTPSRGVKWNQDSMRGVSVSPEPSPTSLPPNPSDASDASPSLAESSSDPVSSALASSSLSLAFSVAAAQRLLFLLCACCQGTRFCTLGGPPVVAVSPSPPPAPRDVKLLCVSPPYWTVARDYPPPPCAETRPRPNYLLFIPLPLTRHCVRL